MTSRKINWRKASREIEQINDLGIFFCIRCFDKKKKCLGCKISAARLPYAATNSEEHFSLWLREKGESNATLQRKDCEEWIQSNRIDARCN